VAGRVSWQSGVVAQVVAGLLQPGLAARRPRMNENGFDTAELANLRERWEREPTPQPALQLAEVYGRRGLAERAAEVLELALSRRPDHLSARVALGRYRLELGETRASVEALERVVATDPTHLVANKLLVKGYSELGRTQKARDRLDLYRLLNESDPEIASLQQLVSVAAGVEQVSVPPSEVAVEPETEEPQGPVEEATGRLEPEPSFDPVETLWEGEPEPVAAAPPVAGERPEPEVAPREERAGYTAGAEPCRPEPFPDLWARLDAALYRQGLFGELFRGGGEGRRARSPLAAEPVPVAAEKARTPTPDPAPDSVLEAPEAEAPPLAPEPASVPAPGAGEEQGESSSVTLADLYADQGHRAEAIRTLRGVLGREPGNEKARLRLAALVASDRGELTAFDLLDGMDFAASVPLEARRARLLRSYLERLGGESHPDV